MPLRRRIFLTPSAVTIFLYENGTVQSAAGANFFENCLYSRDFLLENREVCRAAVAKFLKQEIPNSDFTIGNHEIRGPTPSLARTGRACPLLRAPQLRLRRKPSTSRA
jgi:hypothetical protein